MFKSWIRGSLAAVVVCFGLLPAASDACCFSNWFNCCKPAPAPTYATQCAPVCNVCPQQVNYVPQCCPCSPCTTCRPACPCDPCSGMQSSTTFVGRPVMAPVTTFRPVVTPIATAPACTTCGAAYSSPYYTGAATAAYAAPVAPTAGCPTCGGGGAVTAGYAAPAAGYATTTQAVMTQGTVAGYGAQPGSYVAAPATTGSYAAAPATTYGSTPYGTPTYGAPTYGTPSYSTQPPMGTGTPTPAPAPAAGSTPPTQTFQGGATAAPPANSSMYTPTPIPDSDRTNSTATPRLLDPQPQNRTASVRPLIGPATVGPAIFRTADRDRVFQPATLRTSLPETKPVNDGWSTSDGWQSGASQ